ncbi:hypothetical protein PPTG_03890 [Phytophthora nicotianae INRA-310]|uniref:Uncharacterized protein n=1 Tax=Phytophthora nicotianae (strain INRA-310) TaxID=761204 RepID=W2QYM0_PHYN3|nr:hypothetical protein PPTG_03890 [Phytophthora nicotianae INRA-310]ETN18223.1 hypothetical protein PPTG_03890 [Phytophthora nicotianae INRA-310]
MDKLRRLVDDASSAMQDKLKSGEKELRRAASDAGVRAQQVASDAADETKRRLQRKAVEVKDAARHKAEDVQNAVKHKAEEARAAATTKARGIGNTMLQNLRSNQEHATRQLRENARLLQRSASDTVDDLKKRAQQSATEATSAAQDRVRSSMSEGTAEEDVVLLMLGFIGVFLYGFGSAMPHAMAKYALERAKLEGQAAVEMEEAATSAAKK